MNSYDFPPGGHLADAWQQAGDPYWDLQDRKARRRRFAHRAFVALACTAIAAAALTGVIRWAETLAQPASSSEAIGHQLP